VRRFVPLILAALWAAGGCSSSDEQNETAGSSGKAYVGAVEGTEAILGLVSDGAKVAGYASDGKTLSVWLGPSDVQNGLAELKSREGGDFQGAVEFFEGGARGEINIDGAPFSFEAEPATGEAGVYWSKQGESESGWVVSNDGSAKGLKFQSGGLSEAGAPKGSPLSDPNEEPFTSTSP
jgi:hypothetical protein